MKKISSLMNQQVQETILVTVILALISTFAILFL
jgi:hypothetical protein